MASETLSGAFYWLCGGLQKSIYFYIWSSMILLWRRVNLLKTNKYKNVIFLKIQNWSEGVMVYHLRQEERIQCKLELIVIIWSYILYLKRYFKRHAVIVIWLMFCILDLILRDISHLWRCAFLAWCFVSNYLKFP